MLTPLEIENKRFKKEVFGYNQVEVEDFLSVVSAEYEKIYKDNNAALARINMLTDAIKQYKSMEETLQNAMIVAQKSGEEIRAEASASSSRIVADAETQAQNIIADARRKAAEISYKAEEIKRVSEVFKKQTIELLMEQLDVIKKGHSSSSSEFAISESFEVAEDNEDLIVESSNSTSNSSSEIDLSKILEDVGKISKNLDNYASTDNVAKQTEGSEVEEDSELDDEPEGIKALFDGEEA